MNVTMEKREVILAASMHIATLVDLSTTPYLELVVDSLQREAAYP
jgi:hypothetical protein